ncbi:uncharacterized protein RJT20DRAFT_125340 [Scheffersomyces xylosifermentans]|uniref:uncharacterized protein n=1 Tax=Scheffersomyces xylosifermentans TaxID=1304137 RepID=UPI00315DB676
MSHPAASIKSIFSGRVNLDTPDDLDPFEYSNSNSNYSFEESNNNNSNNDANSSNINSNDNGEMSLERGSNGTATDSDIKFTDKFDDVDDVSSRYSHDSNYSITSKNLRTLSESFSQQPNPNKGFLNANAGDPRIVDKSDTNLSLASTASDYQQNYNTDDQMDSLSTPPPDYLQADPFSRPISSNSTTSCLSTTATKDGVEGKRFHRHGPTTYSSNIIANMLHNQQIQQMQQMQQAHTQSQSRAQQQQQEISNNTPAGPVISITSSPVQSKPLRGSSMQTPNQSIGNDSSIPDPDYSEYSVKTTNAEVDGETGSGGEKKERYFEKRLPPNYVMPPPVTLKEKINLLNTDTISEKK